MRYFITPDGSYYEGDYVATGSIEVTQRPSTIHVWNNGWAIDPTLQAKQERDNNDVIENLDGKTDAAIMALLNQTKAQWVTWVATNLTFVVIPAERNRMGTLFWLVSMCARKLMR